MSKGIYERKGNSGDVTYYIRYQYQLTDIKERVGRRSRGITRELAKEALKSRLGGHCKGSFQSREGSKAGAVFKVGGEVSGVCRRL